ncbi:MAG: molybdopterin-dependent oxidoreductase [Acidovorax sp.]|uniref:molybdopterin-dependent oxidoreductase n=1 Tax=Acidovorax sp. TaxID=1872122 RepID=UPI0025C3B9B0|nr:molybdopterin-dependent oxidoreductase [Acidovorax sp.]MDH4425508.1 molybdopterin-dependent oxidoreductase [Acidovorax sp.]
MSSLAQLIMRRGVQIVGGFLLSAAAFALPMPTGPVVLTISGNVGETNQGKTATFDMAMIEALPQRTFVTTTPWDKQPTKFTGPLLRDVLAAAKAKGKTLTALALNDYKTTIPVDDAQAFDVIVAHRINDQPISVRTKGPLFIIYPFDTKSELKTATYFGRSAWQLKSLTVD